MTDHDLDILTRTLYGEARGEYAQAGPAALIAVANVIINRLNREGRYGKTLTEICLKPKQFSCWNQNDPNRSLITQDDLDRDPLFKACRMVGYKVAKGFWPDLTRNSDHYHATSCKPSWARISKIKLRLANHVFYKLD